MVGDIVKKHCLICDKKTDHEQGNFKSHEIGGELFHLDVSLDDALKKMSDGFRDFVLEEQNGLMDTESPEEYAQTFGGGLDFETLFAPVVRSLKCDGCGHLIKLGRLP